VISGDELVEMMSPNAAAWPIVRAVTARMLERPSKVLIDALSKAGANAELDMLDAAHPLERTYTDAILDVPQSYPSAWVITAERARSQRHDGPPLEDDALKEKWVPKVPRL
jgi:hypothetical protein